MTRETMPVELRNYAIVTGGYWAFTVTDGALRMLVVMYFHLLGYSPFQVAMLFLFYELFGVVTNLVGGWLGARIGVNRTMHIGMALQIAALAMLLAPDGWLSVGYVMAAQALSGIAKDLNKMSAKASVKALDTSAQPSRLFKWVALLTGSKNALKGVGFFVGAALLAALGFQGAIGSLAGLLVIVLIATAAALPSGQGKMSGKPKFTQMFSRESSINWLSAARFFLFASRDVWFVVGLPVFLYAELGWSFTQIGGFLALWVIGYGFVQASTPRLIRKSTANPPGGRTALAWVLVLALVPAAIATGFHLGADRTLVLIAGLAVFAVVFAINSSVHSYLVLAYSGHDNVSMNVGFYYMANAGGRLAGTVLSGWAFQTYGLEGCLWFSAALLLSACVLSLKLPGHPAANRENVPPGLVGT